MIIVQTCLGEKPRARPDAPSWARLRPPRETRSRCGPKPRGSQRRGRAGRGGFAALQPRGGGGGGHGAAWAPGAEGFGEGSRPGGLCVSALPASHFGDGEAARPQIAGRASACSGSLAGRDGAAARRRASRGGRPHPRGPRPRSWLEAAPGPRPGRSHLPAAPLASRAPRRAHGSGGGTAARTPALALARPLARSLARPPAGAPGSRLPRGATARGAALFPLRRRPGSGLALPRRVGATSWPRPRRASSPGLCAEEGPRAREPPAVRGPAPLPRPCNFLGHPAARRAEAAPATAKLKGR